MSDTERFYAAITKQLGGSRSWEQLQPIEQMQFIQALNIMLQICSQ
jgi:hypothetical protein